MEQSLLSLLGLVYDAAKDPALWPDVLSAIGNASRESAKAELLYVPAPVQDGAPAERDPLGRPAPDPAPSSVQYSGLAEFVFRHSRAADALSILEKSLASLAPDEAGRLKELVPHVNRSIEIGIRLLAAEIKCNAGFEILDGLGIGILLLDREGRLLSASSFARSILHGRHGLAAIDGQLRAETPAGNESLAQLIRRTTEGTKLVGPLTLPVDNSNHTLSIAGWPWRPPCLPATCTLLLVGDPRKTALIPEADLERVYGLTPAESRLLQALAGGKRLADYAEEAAISVNTARGYLKQVFSKTRTRRQSELLRLLMSDPLLRLVASRGAEPR